MGDCNVMTDEAGFEYAIKEVKLPSWWFFLSHLLLDNPLFRYLFHPGFLWLNAGSELTVRVPCLLNTEAVVSLLPAK